MIGPRLQIRQSQQLVMTPQLRQAIQLLQLSNLELDRVLDAEIERNPLLTRDEEDGTARSEPARPERALAEGDPAAAPARLDGGAENLWDRDAPLGLAEAGAPPLRGRAPEAAGTDPAALERMPAAEPSLLDHLEAQIRLARTVPEVRATALALAGDVDEAGRLEAETPEAAARLGVTEATVEAAIALLQACDPPGVAARSLAECLALQLAARDRLDPAMRALVENLPRLAAADFRGLARLCGVEEAEIHDMAAELRRLDPRPGRAFSAPAAPAAPPDVIVRPGRDGGWVVELNAETLPRVLVDETYAATVSTAGDKAARGFVSDCARSAAFLVRSLEQRARTILAVATEIVRRQDAFLREGVPGLKPMTLRMVADEIGVHESTVSRVAAGKRLACPRGTFEMRFLFTQALAATSGGEAVSAEAVRARIRALIDGEDPARPLSDDALAARLKAEGVDVARRTVAKYREGMSLPSSTLRRRRKAAAGAG